MIIGLVTVSLSIPDARSLKDKRSVLRRVKDRARNTMNVSVAEVGKQDYWKSADLAFVTVAARGDVVEKRLSEIRKRVLANPHVVTLDIETELL